jgi:hypothetical protein
MIQAMERFSAACVWLGIGMCGMAGTVELFHYVEFNLIFGEYRPTPDFDRTQVMKSPIRYLETLPADRYPKALVFTPKTGDITEKTGRFAVAATAAQY